MPKKLKYADVPIFMTSEFITKLFGIRLDSMHKVKIDAAGRIGKSYIYDREDVFKEAQRRGICVVKTKWSIVKVDPSEVERVAKPKNGNGEHHEPPKIDMMTQILTKLDNLGRRMDGIEEIVTRPKESA